MNKDFKYCYNCGQKLPEIANFCIRCGANQNEINTETENIEVAPVYHQESTTKPAEKQVVGKVFDIISRSLLFAFSLLLILFAFLPNLTLVLDDVEIAHYNSIETIELMFDSFYSLSDSQLEDSDLYDKLVKVSKELGRIDVKTFDDLSAEELKDLNDYIHLTLRLSLRSELSITTIDILLCGILSILYLLFVLAFFVVALLNFIGIFNNKFTKMTSPATILLTIIPGLSVIMYYLIASIFNNALPTKMGIGLILTSLISLTLITFELVKNIICKLTKYNLKDIIFNSIKLAFCTVLMFLVFSPFTVSRLTIDAETEVNNNVFSFYSFIYGSEDEKIYKEWEKLDVAEAMQVFNSNFNSFKYFTEREIEDGYGNSINLVFLLFAAATMGQYEMYFPLYSSIPLFVLASLMLIVVIFQQSLLALLTNKRCQPLLITSSIIQCVFNIVALVFTIIFVICVQEYSIELYCKKDYALSLSAGIIVLVVFSVLLVISILLHTKNKKVIDHINVSNTVLENENLPTEAIAI